MREGTIRQAKPAGRPKEPTMTNRKPKTRPETDLVARYNPVAIRAVVAATLLAKVRRIPVK
jgi:hypothetical protein